MNGIDRLQLPALYTKVQLLCCFSKSSYPVRLFLFLFFFFLTLSLSMSVCLCLSVSLSVYLCLSVSLSQSSGSWIIEFLTHRTQYVNRNGKSSETLITNTGAPQGCVLSPVLYSIYANDYRTMDENVCLIKFADGTTLHGLLSNSEKAYRSEVNRFCEWCKNNHLTLNVDKTKEIVCDYRRKKEPLTPLLIDRNLYLSLIATST